MPARSYMEIDPRRDHGFHVPRPDLSAELGTPNACSGCHPKRDVAWAAQAVAGWFPSGRQNQAHFGTVLDAGRRRLPGAGVELVELAEDPRQSGIVRATALRLLREQPVPGLDALLRSAAADPDPLVRIGALDAAEALPPPARLAVGAPLLRDPLRVVRLSAARALVRVPPDQWRGDGRRDLDRALAELRDAAGATSDQPQTHLELGTIHVARGDGAAARRAYETALRLEPWFTPAAVNLADLARLEGNEPEAERVLRAGLARSPQDASLLHALGLSLVRQGRRDHALVPLRRAAELAPETARHAYVYAVAVHDAGETAEALEVLSRTHERHPGDAAVLQALVAYHRERGDEAMARSYAEKLAELTSASGRQPANTSSPSSS